MNKKNKLEWMLSLPSLTWLALFFLIPSCIIFAYAFKPQNIYGGIEPGWSLDAFRSIMDPNYYFLIGRTFVMGALTTLVCLLLALPVGYNMARVSAKTRRVLTLLIVLPFWTSFLIRIFAWKTLLHPEGYIQHLLASLHLIDPHTTLLYNQAAVLLVMVYTYLPFAIFPIYAAASKFNFHLLEAAMDLGATRRQAFFKVFIPGINKGLLSAGTMVFIAATGAYIIPDLIGGFNSEMIGTKIAQRIFIDRDLPQASALSVLLSLLILLPLLVITLISYRPRKIEAEARNRE